MIPQKRDDLRKRTQRVSPLFFTVHRFAFMEFAYVSRRVKQENSVKYRRMSLAVPYVKPCSLPETDKETEETASTTSTEGESITITAYYDYLNRLTELVMQKTKLPRILFQILSLILPHYPILTKLIVKKCRINGYIIYEINKFLSLTNITEICLDDSPVPEANYALLLESQSRLTTLSLCRCRVNDEACKKIASKLHFLLPAEATVSSLNLSSNHITDEGAKYLGEALRTNRHLRYLNLADNRIGDEGAYHIFQALIDFPLTCDEIMSKRRRYMAYLSKRQGYYIKYLTEFQSRSMDDFSILNKKASKKSTSINLKTKVKKNTKSKYGDDIFHTRAESMAIEVLGPFKDPFSSFCTKVENGSSYCIGNMVLCYLNLCYNHLSYLSVKKLQLVLFYQSVNKMINQTGLMKVLLDGNPIPLSCSEIERINEMMNNNIANFSSKYVMNKLRGRARISMIPK